MLNRRHLLIAAAAAALVRPAVAQEKALAEKLKVVASFSILADLVARVGGDRVSVDVLVGPGGDAHVYSPTPSDARKLAAAKLVVVNGLGFEGWLERLITASGTRAAVVIATKGVASRQPAAEHDSHGHSHDADPHAWQSVANAAIYVANIRDALVAADPAGQAAYRANASAFLAELDALDGEVKTAMARIPAEQRRIITTHDAFGYFAAAYGITFMAPQGVSTETEASARDVARIIAQIKKTKVRAVFLENVTDPRLLKRISAETGARIGGTLYSDALTSPGGEAPSYADMIRHNVRQFVGALAGN
jgi:zinc/manganese transport system substrate-binding protein